ncbi:acetolactate decarboxylase [Ruminococcus sp. FC2018]|uniref:acetolactate decarboxylase n=1 Tax=Ruminococcus sp. FC2018 TaxID=1410617 RepID=UPI00048B1F35|nr:acetolactate decarboxylase [Ruminococcus sp. FC2018]
MKKKMLMCALALAMLTSCGDSSSSSEIKKDETPKADRETIYQVSLLQGLTLGDYYGSVSVKELKQKGDTGIGTFEGVNGELIMVDGTVYRAKSDGSIEAAPDDETIPFANVTFFDTDEKQDISGIANIADIKKLLDEKVEKLGKNQFYMVRIDGTFKKMHARSELKQEQPYKPLAEALKTDQREFSWDNIEGTVVALYCPQYMKDLNAAGWHLHFVSKDKKYGGHVLDLDIDSAELKIDCTQGFNMQLPNTEKFPSLDLTKDQSDDIKKVETKD